MIESDYIELEQNKKEWINPSFQIIPFTNTNGGGVNTDAEDDYTNPQGS